MSVYTVAVFLAVFLPAASCLNVIQMPQSIIIHEGEPTVILCNFSNGMERLAVSAEFYRWPDYKNPINSSADGRIIFSSTDTTLTMIISEAITCDSGKYVCSAKLFNGGPFKGNGTTLNVVASTIKHGAPECFLQTIIDVARLTLLLILIILVFILIWKSN